MTLPTVCVITEVSKEPLQEITFLVFFVVTLPNVCVCGHGGFERTSEKITCLVFFVVTLPTVCVVTEISKEPQQKITFLVLFVVTLPNVCVVTEVSKEPRQKITFLVLFVVTLPNVCVCVCVCVVTEVSKEPPNVCPALHPYFSVEGTSDTPATTRENV